MCLCHSHVHCSGADGNEAFAEAKITFLWSRFHVELDDERAGQKIRAIIQESAKVIAHHPQYRLRFRAFTEFYRRCSRQSSRWLTPWLSGGSNKVNLCIASTELEQFSMKMMNMQKYKCFLNNSTPAHNKHLLRQRSPFHNEFCPEFPVPKWFENRTNTLLDALQLPAC